MINIDGSMGEGGGQILRTSLGLSVVTGRPFTITNIRAGRKKPGLMRQHLTAVQAAAEISGARIAGDQLGSTQLIFEPGNVRPGVYHFAVGTAGSATLVLQTILPGLLTADGPSQITIEGGTHNPYAPPFHFLYRSFLPVLKRMGAEIQARLINYGFYPAGGGKMEIDIKPVAKLQPLELNERGKLKTIKAKAYVANLPDQIAERELSVIRARFPDVGDNVQVVRADNSPGPGNIVTIEMEYENITELITGFGEVNKRAEKVGSEVAEQARKYLASDAPVGKYLADQLMIPFALAGGGEFVTLPLSRHAQTNLEVIRLFKPSNIIVNEWQPRAYKVKF